MLLLLAVVVVVFPRLQGQTTGFTLDSLLKLNTAKAFDKKTSILHYLVMLARRNDPTLLEFKDVSQTNQMFFLFSTKTRSKKPKCFHGQNRSLLVVVAPLSQARCVHVSE